MFVIKRLVSVVIFKIVSAFIQNCNWIKSIISNGKQTMDCAILIILIRTFIKILFNNKVWKLRLGRNNESKSTI